MRFTEKSTYSIALCHNSTTDSLLKNYFGLSCTNPAKISFCDFLFYQISEFVNIITKVFIKKPVTHRRTQNHTQNHCAIIQKIY